MRRNAEVGLFTKPSNVMMKEIANMPPAKSAAFEKA